MNTPQLEPILPRYQKITLIILLLVAAAGSGSALWWSISQDNASKPVVQADGRLRGEQQVEAITKDLAPVRIKVRIYEHGVLPEEWSAARTKIISRAREFSSYEIYVGKRERLCDRNVCYVESVTFPVEVMRDIIEEGRIP